MAHISKRDAPSEHRAAVLSFAFGGAVIVLLASSLLFTKNGFASDFTNLIWLGSVQAHTAMHGLIPSYFINTNAAAPLPVGYTYPYPQTGLLDPVYGYYGGPLLSILGYLTVACFNNVVAAFLILTMLGFCASYYGLYWIARQAGCARIIAHAAAITFVASAYYLTDLYGRGDWLEFIAVSALPLFAACAADLLSARPARASSIVLLFVAAVFFTGSHNTTFLWGTLFMALVAVILLATRVVNWPRWSRLGIVALVSVLAVGIDGWALVPALAYSSHTVFVTSESVIGTNFVDTFPHLFDPFRMVPPQSTTPGLYVQVPDWMLAWGIGLGTLYCGFVSRRRSDRRLLASFLGLSGLYLFLMLNRQIWNYLPHLLWTIQNPFLLSTYFTLSVCALVITAGASAPGRVVFNEQLRRSLRRLPVVSLAACTAITIGIATWQVLIPNDQQPIESYANRYDAITPPNELPHSWYAVLDWVDTWLPIYSVAADRTLALPVAVVNSHGDGIDTSVLAPAGLGPIATNIVAVPEFVSVRGGLKVIGRTSSGYLVLQRVVDGDGYVPFIVSSTASSGIRVGRIITAASTIGIVLCLIWLVFFGISRARRDARSRRTQGREPVGSPRVAVS